MIVQARQRHILQRFGRLSPSGIGDQIEAGILGRDLKCADHPTHAADIDPTNDDGIGPLAEERGDIVLLDLVPMRLRIALISADGSAVDEQFVIVVGGHGRHR